jgi:hypothetical protein
MRSLGDRFVVKHQSGPYSVVFAAYSFKNLVEPLGTIAIDGNHAGLTGDIDIWADLGRVFLYRGRKVSRFESDEWIVRVSAGRATLMRLRWHDEYDLLYQGVVGVCELMQTNELLFGVQRSSRLVICDPETLNVITTTTLPGENGGNPNPMVSPNGEVWVTNYDTVVCVDASGRNILRSRRMQGPSAAGGLQFSGTLSLSPDGRSVLVPRPFEGDVQILDANDLSVVRSIHVGDQPLDAVMLHDGSIASISWKTNEFTISA